MARNLIPLRFGVSLCDCMNDSLRLTGLDANHMV